MRITTPPAFSYELCYQFLERSPRELLHRCAGNDVVKLIGDSVVHISPGKDHLKVKFLTDTTAADREVVRQYIVEWFDLATDLSPFYRMAAKDKLLGPLAKQYYGYRIVGQPDLFESLVWAVIGQQINLAFAYTLKGRFVEQFGGRHMLDGHTYYRFPLPGDAALLTDNDLLPLQFSRQKSKYVVAIAEAFASGQLSREMVATLPLQAAKETLMKIKGVGNWTANYALMKTFRHPDAFPLEDAGLHNAIRQQLKLASKPTLAEVQKIFKRYRGWEAYATLYLWKSL
ncbi:MAG: DNA-3-methyladenine glycosylase 2 family protein [Bacteroidia bacterium]|nr:DNA-3-methyladenine glycosylase 2 family protein [Bacteroidia bacterium]